MTKVEWEALERVFTVERLMTPRIELMSLRYDDKQSPRPDFDVVPAVDGERIVGVFEKESPNMLPLSDRWLITRDTGIPELLDLFVETRQKAYLVYSRNEVIGLVTPADLNKLPARAYIYNLIGELETVLATIIRAHFGENISEMIGKLSEKRQNGVRQRQAELEQGNADVELVETFFLSDLITIVEKTAELQQKLGLPSRSKTEKLFSGINVIRTQTMHLVKPLLVNVPQDLETLQDRIKRIKDILNQLAQQPEQ
jgi:hypothetical protein